MQVLASEASRLHGIGPLSLLYPKMRVQCGGFTQERFLSQYNSHLPTSPFSVIKNHQSAFRTERQVCSGFGDRALHGMLLYLIQT